MIRLQLDNEIGMLAWVSNTPDLTDDLLASFRSWCDEEHQDALGARYPVDRDWRKVVESPDEEWAAALRVDLGRFMRTRFAPYVQALTEMARDNGIRGIPLLVNVHGAEGGNGGPARRRGWARGRGRRAGRRRHVHGVTGRRPHDARPQPHGERRSRHRPRGR